MRIISGEYRGRRFSGRIPSIVRPTTDIVRESIFNRLMNICDFHDLIAADICAGTGMMGFEALSRGAKKCFFFEKNRKVIQLINNVADKLSIPKEKYEIISGDAIKKILQFNINNPNIKFGIAFFDPPYKGLIINDIIQSIHSSDIIEDAGLFVAEHSIDSQIIIPENWAIINESSFGDTKIEFIECKLLK